MSTFDRATAAHVLARVGFGAPADVVDAAVSRGLEATLDELCARRADSAALERGLDGLLSLGELGALQAHWFARILADTAPFVERVTLMWHGHFATSHTKVDDVRLMHRQNELFRARGLGDFRELLHAVATDPAMLLWLDGDRNRAGRPNENFAREVMELFALGVDAGYSEADVHEAARAFSGAGVDRREYVFRPEHHDAGDKSLFGRGGVVSGADALDRILAHPACPRWVARRLLATFCAPEPAREDCERWGQVLVEEGWRIDRTLARLFRSELFLGPGSRRARIASPVELAARAVITLRCKVSPREVARAAAEMGQALFLPPTVEGWVGGRAWIHTGTWLARHNHLVGLVASSDRFEPRRALGQGLERSNVVERAVQALFPDGVDPALRALLDDAATRADSVDAAARDVVALCLISPEGQLV